GQQIFQSALTGSNPSVTAAAVLTLVHATRAPMAIPKILAVAVDADQLNVGQREIPLAVRMLAHVPSTGEIEFDAEWQDIEDYPAAPEAIERASPEPASKVTLDHPLLIGKPPSAQPPFTLAGTHLHPDTRHRVVRLTPTATARHADEFAKGEAAAK